ncbi:MAG: polysaccharide biosynthesis protein [Chitinophagaceae bacterium]|nr:polysaccharide biosynthesis protein [Chitinophagaceae bacterium]
MQLLRSVSIYTFSGIALGGINFLLMPLLTHYLNKEDFGYLSLITSYVAFLTPAMLLGSVGIASIEYFKMEKESFRKFLSSSMISPTLLLFLLTIICFFFTAPIAQLTSIPENWVKLLPLVAYSGYFMQLYMTMCQVTEKAATYSVLNISFSVVSILLSLVFVITWNYGYEGRLWGILLSSVLFSILSFFFLIRMGFVASTYSREHVLSSLKYGLPLVPHALSFLIIDMSDRIFIAKLIDVETVGLYNVGYQMGVIIFVLVNAFVQGYSPFLFNALKLGDEQSKLKIVRISYLFIIGLCLCLCALYFATPFIFQYLIGKEFLGGAIFVFWVGLGYVFLGMYKMVVGVLFYEKKTVMLSALAVINVALNLLLNYFMIRSMGAIGAAYATALSYLIVFVITFYLANRMYKLPWFKLQVLKL